MWRYIRHVDLHSITSSPSVYRKKTYFLLKSFIKTETLKTAEGKTMTLCLLFLTEEVMGMGMV